MNAQILTFSANEQTLIKTGGIDDFASNTVRYAKATFTLGTNWTGFDSVRAVWKTACYTISTVLDANHSCDVPPEVLSYKAKVYVNLVGSISENGVLTDRLTTFPVLAMHIKSNAPVEGTETAPVTASQFEQFVETVQNAAESISDYSYDSEAWAVGKRGGVDVPSTDPTYHNNSKYWAEQNAGLADDVADLKSEINELESLYYKRTQAITGSYTFPCTIIAGEKYVVTNNASANASCNTADSSGTTIDSLGNIAKNGGTAKFTATANAVQLKGWTGGSGNMTIERLSAIVPKMQSDLTDAEADIEQNTKTINDIATGTDLIKGNYVNAGMSSGQLVPSQTYRVTSSDFISYDRIVKIFPKDSSHKIYLDLVSDEEVYQTSIYILPNQFRFVAAGQKFRLSIVTTGEEIWGTYADIDEYVNAVGVSNIYSDILAHNVLSPFNKPFMGSSRIKIAQHRGWHDEATIYQNTIKAFVAAGKRQAWAIETDIWETIDNHFVIMHDQDVSTTTDGTGNINEMTLAQVEALTITNDPTQHVPTLEEYLGICKTYGCVPLIEIKGFQSTTASAQRLVNVLSDFGLLENCMLITPAFILEYVRNVTEDVPCVVVVTVSNYETMIGNISRYKNVGLGFDSSGTVTSTIVKDCHDRGYLVNVWTTESVESATGYYALGVDFVTSDKLSTSDFLV